MKLFFFPACPDRRYKMVGKIKCFILSLVIVFCSAVFVYIPAGEASQGVLLGWGYNNSGQLGDGTTTDKLFPTPIGTNNNWSFLSAGSYHTVAIKTDGTLWGWGDNYYGQLGDGTTSYRYSPTQIGTDANWSSVSAGGAYTSNYTAAIKIDGTLWSYGDGTYSPIQIGTDSNWSSVSAGYSHTVAIKTDGTLWAWGAGYGTTPVQVGTDTNWSSVSAGFWHTAAIKTDGTLWAWGRNVEGQLGDGTGIDKSSPIQIGTDTDWSSVSAGGYHTVAIRTDGTLWAWGSNGSGQLGDGTEINKLSPTKIGIATNWLFVSAGGFHTIAIKGQEVFTLTVCSSGCPFTTIQGAINAAINGDTVLVSPGTYNETINFYGKAITVKGAKCASQTIIDGGGLGTVVYFGSGEGNNSVLDGFTIKGGSAMYGGGIRAINSSPIIKNNIITGNTAINY